MIRFFVPGVPAPGGSKRGVAIYRGKKGEARVFTGKVAVIESAKRALPWRIDVQGAARAAMANAGDMRPLEGPLELDVVFVMPRPRGHYGKRGLRSSAPAYPAIRPDALKLARSLEDALSGVVYVDDSQIVREVIEKRYGNPPGAYVLVRRMEGTAHVGARDGAGDALSLGQQRPDAHRMDSGRQGGAPLEAPQAPRAGHGSHAGG